MRDTANSRQPHHNFLPGLPIRVIQPEARAWKHVDPTPIDYVSRIECKVEKNEYQEVGLLSHHGGWPPYLIPIDHPSRVIGYIRIKILNTVIRLNQIPFPSWNLTFQT